MAAENPNEQLQFTAHDEWYRSFLANTNQKAVQQKTLVDVISGNYPSVWGRIINPDYPLSILMIGAGTGESEAAFASTIKTLRESYGWENVSLFYEDVSPQMHERFKATANAFDINSAVKDYSLEKFEDAAYSTPDSDLSLAFQMWYYVKGWDGIPSDKNSLTKFADSVDEKKGVGVLSVHSKEGDLFQIRGGRLPMLHGHDDLTGDRLHNELQRLGVTFQEFTLPARTNIESFFQHGVFDPTDEGLNILSFMLRTPWETLASQIKGEVQKDVERLVDSNGGPHLLFRDTYFFIPQQRS